MIKIADFICMFQRAAKARNTPELSVYKAALFQCIAQAARALMDPTLRPSSTQFEVVLE